MTIDDFQKVELKTGKVLEAERVEGSEKLLRLKVDIGSETRQVLAGIGKVYTPESLVGRTIIIVANLEPRQMMGLESQGMLLAAGGSAENLAILTTDPTREMPPGSVIR